MNSTLFKVHGTSGMFFGKNGTLQWFFPKPLGTVLLCYSHRRYACGIASKRMMFYDKGHCVNPRTSE